MSDNGSGTMAGKIVLVTGGTGGIGKATAIGAGTPWRPGRHRRPDRRRAEAAAARDPLASRQRRRRLLRRRPLVAGRGAPPRGGGARRLPPPRRAGQQRGRILGDAPRHGRRPRAHVRGQPPRPVPAHQPAARSASGPARRRGSSRCRRGRSAGPRSTSTTSRASAATRPTGLQPVEARQRMFTYELARRLEGTGVTANCCTPASSAPASAPRIRAHPQARWSRSRGRS